MTEKSHIEQTEIKITIYDDWSNAELELRRARAAYNAATENLVDRITEVYGAWPCDESDPEFISIESEDGPVMLELRPFDSPTSHQRPFYIHHLEVVKL